MKLIYGLILAALMALPARAFRQSIIQLGASPYIAAVFLSAALVFLVQPMFAKMATPLLGGAPNVWNVSLVCFQAALLLGYAYAHLLNHFVASLRRQIAIHAGLLLLAALVLPFQLSTALGDPVAHGDERLMQQRDGLGEADDVDAAVSSTCPCITLAGRFF